MYSLKFDEIFGSDFIMVTVDDLVKNLHPSATYHQAFKMRRTNWKSLDSPKKRCNDDGTKSNTTHCLTNYFEHVTGCSMSLPRSDPKIAR